MMTSPSQVAECAAAEESDVFDVEFPAYEGVDGMMKISFKYVPVLFGFENCWVAFVVISIKTHCYVATPFVDELKTCFFS